MDDVFENFTINILKLNKLVHKIKLAEMEEYRSEERRVGKECS